MHYITISGATFELRVSGAFDFNGTIYTVYEHQVSISVSVVLVNSSDALGLREDIQLLLTTEDGTAGLY